MEIRNNRIRITTEEAFDPRWVLMGNRFVRNAEDLADPFLYFVANPAEQQPWRVFLGTSMPRPIGPPAEFLEIFGLRPIGDLGLINDWELVLGAWQGPKQPPDAGPGALAEAQLLFAAYGLGRPRFFALARPREAEDRLGEMAYKVAFPDAEHREVFSSWWPKMFATEARLAIFYTQYAIADYQTALRGDGVSIEPERLVPFLGGRRIMSAGHL
mgnify:CR=1 FL=1